MINKPPIAAINHLGGTTRTMGLAALAVAVLLLVGCAEARFMSHAVKTASHQTRDDQGGVYKVGNPYKVAGVWYYPKEEPGYDETGIASWYGKKFHGKYTANGEVYNMDALTAAHKTLPMPVKVRVTNLENGRSLVLRVNDRGPFVHGRVIDVSRRAAELLGFKQQGIARVRVQLIEPGGKKPRETFVAKRPVTRAEERVIAAAPRASVTSAALPTNAAAEPAALPVKTTSASVPPEVELRPVPATTQLFVQAGAFRNPDNAHRLSANLAPYAPSVGVSPAIVNGQQFYRVRVGPLATVEAADVALEQVMKAGHPGARIIID
ncbi:MAG TPA: septal ring lytic transglycosylase RlpA family protein [Alphaproteobacteria bacterium]|nr:septal ring lytic transglycosylase RlpA family protein [Alphaproteobacteria bacterium]HBF98736.1 septal ring lytic transglycosylase RlpA family protein [Alphaproteobacteria bacterium]HCO90200.1 septal ring lytic transglycosylase RlpA family protein [Alphaproteobacteria bacterium]